jgi:glycosyltransferase involved in cell wall biosynthesis
MKSSKIFIIDKLVIGNNHIIFNSSFITIISKIFPNSEIIFYSEELHSKVIKNKVDSVLNISYKTYKEIPLPVSKWRKILPWIIKRIERIYFIYSIIRKEKDAKSFFFTTLSTTCMYYVNNMVAKKISQSVYIVLHGEVEFLFKSKLYFLDKIRKLIYAKFIQNLSDNVRIIVLSEVVKNALIKKFGLSDQKIIFIRHPIMHIPDNRIRFNDHIIFGHIGAALKQKSSELFFDLAHDIKKEYADSSGFILIGQMEARLVSKCVAEVDMISKDNNSISQEVYEQNVQNIDYAIFTFDCENYIYRDSGAVMDAIAYAKPIIALNQDYFTHLFNIGGNIGFLCDNITIMEETIKNIIKKNPAYIEQYFQQCSNLINLSKMYSLSVIENLLKKQL